MTPSTDTTRTTILVVDDEDYVRIALRRFLVQQGYDVVLAGDGDQALEKLDGHPEAAVMISDIRMPGMSGVELVPQALAKNADLAIIMATAVDDPTTAVRCMKLGAYDYVLKPIDLDALQIQLSHALRRRKLEIERRDLELWLAREVARRTRELEETVARVESLTVGALTALVNRYEEAAAERPPSAAVANIARALGQQLGLRDGDLEEVVVAAHLHRVMSLDAVRTALSGFANFANVEAFGRDPSNAIDAPIGPQIVRAAWRYAEAGMAAVEAAGRLSPRVVEGLRALQARGERLG